jgi:hypothetical protein
MILKEPLQFVFSGYSIWLEPEQFQHDLDLAIKTTTTQLGLPLSIPSPHITAVYGISHLSEDSVRERFESIGDSLQDSWPIMIHEGFRNDIEISGVDSGEMVSRSPGVFVPGKAYKFTKYCLILGHGVD